ncbi:MAG TPA: extracellular solute-binding protein [Firmicutes bacterium]|nr:extracellular solute-binding protein [Bacillota bacterium]
MVTIGGWKRAKSGVLLVGILVLVFVLGMAALAIGAAAAEKVKITAVFSPDLTEQIQAAAARFMAKNPSVEVEVLGFDGDRNDYILVRQAAGMPIDIIEASTTISPVLIGAGVGAELSKFLDEDPDLALADFALGAVRPFMRSDKEIYALPMDLRMYIVIIDMDRADAVGLANPNTLSKKDWNWDRLAEYAKRLTSFTPEGQVERPAIAMRWDAPFNFIYQAGGRFVDHPVTPQKSTFNTPEAVQALEFIQSLMLPTPYLRVDGSLAKKDAWMQLGATTKSATELAGGDISFDVVPWPHGPVDDSMVVGTTGLMLNSQSKNKNEAWSFLKHLLTDVELVRENIVNTMRPSAYLPYLRYYTPAYFPAGLPAGFALLPQFAASPTLDTAPAFNGWEEIVEHYRNLIRRSLPTGEKSPRQILEELDNFAGTFLPVR